MQIYWEDINIFWKEVLVIYHSKGKFLKKFHQNLPTFVQLKIYISYFNVVFGVSLNAVLKRTLKQKF